MAASAASLGVGSSGLPSSYSQSSSWRRTMYLAALILMWYLFSYLFNANLKRWFRDQAARHAAATGLSTPSPNPPLGLQDALFPLLFSIFLSNTAATALWVLQTGSRHGCELLGTQCLTHLVLTHPWEFGLLCLSGVTGVTATVLVLQYGSIQLVQIARSVGPLFTAGWAYLALNQGTTGARLACLAVTLAGTVLASWQEPSFCLAAASLMFIVNATLTYRNVATKRFLMLLPHVDATTLAGALLALTSAVGLVLTTLLWGSSLLISLHPFVPPHNIRHLLLLGTYNFAYNLASQLVLANVAVVSHGMMELFKRIFVLVAAAVLLQDVEWQWHNVVGGAIACAATAMYFRCSHHSPHTGTASHHHHRQYHTSAFTDARHMSDQKAATSLYGPRMGGQGDYSSEDMMGCSGEGDGSSSGQSIRSSVGGVHHGGATTWQTFHSPSSYTKPSSQTSSFIVLLSSPAGRSWIAQWLITVLLLASPIQFVQGVDLGDIRPARAWTSWAAGTPAGPGLALQGDPGSGAKKPGTWPIPHLKGPAFVAGIHGTPWSPYLQQVRTHHRAPAGKSVCDPAAGAEKHARHGVARSTSVASHDSLGYGHQPTVGQAAVQRVGTKLLHLARRILQLEQQHHHQYVPQASRHMLQAGNPTAAAAAAATTAGALLRAAVSDFTKGRSNDTITSRGSAAPASMTALLGIYTGWIGRDNLGDEVVADIFFDLLVEAVLRSTDARTQVSIERNDTGLATRHPGCDASTGSACDYAVMGGGSTIYMDYVKRVADTISADAPVFLFGSGRQMGLVKKRLNEGYIQMLGQAAAHVGGVRGPHTTDYMARVGKKRLPIIRDSGFLTGALYAGGQTSLAGLLPAPLPGRVGGSTAGQGSSRSTVLQQARQLLKSWQVQGQDQHSNHIEGRPSHRLRRHSRSLSAIAESDRKAAPLIVVTMDGEVSKRLGELMNTSARGLGPLYMHVMRELIHKHGYQVVLQAVDDRSRDLHAAYLDSLNSMLPPGAQPIRVHNETFDWAAVVDLYARATVSLNSRLHSGVLAASALTPAVYIASNIKYHDFMASLGLQGYILDPHAAELAHLHPQQVAQQVVDLVLAAASNQTVISSQLEQLQHETLQMYREAMVDLLNILEEKNPARFRAIMCCSHVKEWEGAQDGIFEYV